MTYLQLMIMCLNFFKNEKDKFDVNDFYFFWLANTDDDIDLYYKSKAKEAILYLILLEAKNHSNTNNLLLKLLENDLSYFDVSLYKTLEKIDKKIVMSMIEDPYMFDQMCLLEQGELIVEEQNEIIGELLNEFQRQIPEELEIQQYESAIHSVMEMVSQIIPELFFTEKGYKYIDNVYQINDINLRKKCYEFLKENIKYYNSERIYKVDKNIYSVLYGDEDESDQIGNLNEDEIRGQVDIYGEDIDNYDILFYSTTLLVVMLKLIKGKQYNKLEKLIKIDEEMTNFYGSYGFYSDKTLIESLYQPKTMGQDYHKEISTPSKSDFFLNFFLSDNEFTQQYTIQQLSLIIAFCFDLFDSEPINNLYKNTDTINEILTATNTDNQEEYLNKEEKIKRLVRIKKDNR